MLNHIASKLSRRASCTAIAALLLTGLANAAPNKDHSGEYLSIKGNTVNVRAKPTTNSEIAWELINGYPVQVMKRQGDWIKVKDFEGPLGWVHQSLTSSDPHFLLKVNNANLRAGAGRNHKVVTKLSKYDIVKTLEKKGEWAKVRTSEGVEGWMLEELGWGW